MVKKTIIPILLLNVYTCLFAQNQLYFGLAPRFEKYKKANNSYFTPQNFISMMPFVAYQTPIKKNMNIKVGLSNHQSYANFKIVNDSGWIVHDRFIQNSVKSTIVFSELDYQYKIKRRLQFLFSTIIGFHLQAQAQYNGYLPQKIAVPNQNQFDTLYMNIKASNGSSSNIFVGFSHGIQYKLKPKLDFKFDTGMFLYMGNAPGKIDINYRFINQTQYKNISFEASNIAWYLKLGLILTLD